MSGDKAAADEAAAAEAAAAEAAADEAAADAAAPLELDGDWPTATRSRRPEGGSSPSAPARPPPGETASRFTRTAAAGGVGAFRRAGSGPASPSLSTWICLIDLSCCVAHVFIVFIHCVYDCYVC